MFPIVVFALKTTIGEVGRQGDGVQLQTRGEEVHRVAVSILLPVQLVSVRTGAVEGDAEPALGVRCEKPRDRRRLAGRMP